MTIADYVILATILLSMGLSLYRGFAIEAISLFTWVAAFVISRLFSVPFAVILAEWIDPPSARQPIAFVALFVLTLVVGALIKHLVKQVVNATGLSGTDRLLGSVFGLLRGCLIVVVALIVLSRMTQAPADPWWRASLLIPHFMTVEAWTEQTGEMLWQKLMAVGDD